jgi:DNA-binding LacI/PurR family transcriptional regulator
MNRQRPTINDVAARAGVSKSLVSLVIRGSPNVSAARRDAVRQAAAELGYRPNAVARSLVEQRTHIVGLLVSDLHNPFFAEVIDGLQDEARRLGYRMLLGSGNRVPAEEEETVEALLQLRIDALILLSPALPPAIVRQAAQTVPVTVVGHRGTRIPGVDTVGSDDALGTALAVEHLVALGHRRIAHIAGARRRWGADPRCRGYEAAMERVGLAAFRRIVEGDYTTDEGGYEGMARLLASGPRPTAVLAVNDLAAVGAIAALDDHGHRVPEDVSVVGYDNSALAAVRHLSLTSVNQSRWEMGRLAMAAVHDRIEGTRRRAGHRVLAPDLVVRNTTGPPPACPGP